MRVKTILSILLLIIVCVAIYSEEKPIITILDFDTSGISQAETTLFIDYIATHIH